MEAKYIFFNKLELDSNHRFSIDFEKRNTSLQEILHYFITNLKVFVKLVVELTKL